MQTGRKQGERRGAANRQRGREITEDTLFLQNGAGVLKVRVAVTSFPVVSAPPATGGAPQSSARCGRSEVRR